MKQLKRSGIYKAANVTFDPKTVEAYSYNWWRFVQIIQGKVVFNNYRYSVTTAKHQSKVRGLMYELGIKIDVFVQLRCSLSEINFKEGALRTVNQEIRELTAMINRKGSRKSTNAERRELINMLMIQAQTLKSMGCED